MRSPPLNHIYLWSGWIDKLNTPRVEALGHPHPLPKVFLRITHISETILSILTKLCPNVPCMILFQSYVRYVWGPKKGPRGGLKWLIILIFKNLLVNQQCQKIDTWHITLINLENSNPVWPNDFDWQLGCCISDAFSIFLYFLTKQSLNNYICVSSLFYCDFIWLTCSLFGHHDWLK